MSVSGISASSSLSQSMQGWQVRAQKIQSEFQQLGQDLQAGNLTKAQSDFSILSQNVGGSLQGNSVLAQTFGSLGSALQSGNLAAARQAYSSIQQDVQQSGQGAAPQHHHRHGGMSISSPLSSVGTALTQAFGTLGTALQSGNLSAAQSAYSSLAQDLQQLSAGAGTAAGLAAEAVSFLG
jgi:hypothetical protein